MKLSVQVVPVKTSQKKQSTCFMVGMFENGDLTETGKNLNKISRDYLKKLIKQQGFVGKIGLTLPLFHVPHTPYEQILLVGCGAANAVNPGSFRKIILMAMKAVQLYKIKNVICCLTELTVKDNSLAWKVKQITEVAHNTLYRFDMFKSKKEPAAALKQMIIQLPEHENKNNKTQQIACKIALKQGEAIADGVAFTKNLANLPSNICTPTFLAEQAKALAKTHKNISVKILGEKDMQQLKMGGILGVSQGSVEEAKLICLEYLGGDKKTAPIALVGKGVTFETGGNSLKPADSMVGMKYDMCGAATVMGTIKAAAELALPLNVVGVIAAVENMPGGTAYKPEDILTSMSGQTIEIISTDAEGRVILADALTYCERYHPDVVIDIATLTGAVVIALGFHTTGLLGNDEALAKDLLKAGEESHDRAWQLPLWDEYQEQINSPFADISNTGGRAGGVITAACFLSRFAKKFRWAHLDVAGTAALMIASPERAATGRPVPMLMQYLINRANAAAKK